MEGETKMKKRRESRGSKLHNENQGRRRGGVCGGGDIEDFFSEEAINIRACLLEWYDNNQRDLPWRTKATINDNDDRRAYAVWVSEVMLQQTRVAAVVDYYNRWMHKWPSLHHLAQASLEEVNDMWAGLGYYRRARFLLEGAKMIVEQRGRFPRTVSTLKKVPGIGDYTAGAIASIAFKEVVPVVDGNVVRVIARLKAISANPKESSTIKTLWKLAAQLVDPCRPGDFNQALMELGATICSPLNPSCSMCPVSGHCNALSISKLHEKVIVTDYPLKVIKAKQRHEFSAVCVVELTNGQDNISEGFLLVKRPHKGLLAGMWEFPSVVLNKESEASTRREAIDHLLKKSFKLHPGPACNVVTRENVGEYVHVFSHIRLKMYIELMLIQLKGETNVLCQKHEKKNISWKCVDSKTISSMGLTSGVRKVYSMIEKYKQENSPSLPLPTAARTRKKPTHKKLKST